ncbi:MAG: hypothetical protein AB3N21_12215 [Ruegeria sp.]|uniref:hypothetical protein n=1 Tax=Ruegeria sp. TaxID=1879320 RepID=UPI00349E95C7
MFILLMLLVGGIFSFVLNGMILWFWGSIAAGRREATVGKSLLMFVSLSTVVTVLGLGSFTADGAPFLTAWIWPAVLMYSIPGVLAARLFVLVIAMLLVFGATSFLYVKFPGRVRVVTLALEAIAAVIVPVTLQNMQTQRQMRKAAEGAGLKVVASASLFRSIRRRSAAYMPPHGIACDAEDWPHLWSYKQRDWIALPTDTRFGGDTPERVKGLCN